MDPRAAFLSDKFAEQLHAVADETERSHLALKNYFEQILRWRPPPGVNIEFTPTDAKDDGGLDGYVVDSERRKVTVFQVKWFSALSNRLSEDECRELLGFCQDHLLPDDKGKLNEPVAQFIARWHAYHSKWDLELVYLTNAEFLLKMATLYRDAGFALRILDLQAIGEEWQRSLSQQEEPSNSFIFVLPSRDTISLEAKFPLDSGDLKIDVVQCAIRGLDLKSAYNRYQDKLFLRNLREFLKGKINREIKESAEGGEAEAFYVLHNGISIIAEDFDVCSRDELATAANKLGSTPADVDRASKEASDAHYDRFLCLKNFQIVNGAQSTVTISKVADDTLPKLILPCKVSKTALPIVASRIAVCNNTQNQIKAWDLVSNAEEHVFLQNWAASLSPAVFYQRKRGEKWGAVVMALEKPRPDKERVLLNEKAYQAFLAFVGHPGPAYTRPGTLLVPNGAVYNQIKSYDNPDIMILTGLLSTYEKSARARDEEEERRRPDFERFWQLWSIAAFGHVFRHHLNKSERLTVTAILLGAEGHDLWRNIRTHLSAFFNSMFKEYFQRVNETGGHQDFFKNDETLWALDSFTAVKPRDIWTFLPTEMHLDSYREMKEAKYGPNIHHYDLNFAIVARLFERLSKESPDIVDRIRNKIRE